MRQTTLEDFSQETIQCNGSLLSPTAVKFRHMYIKLMITEALTLTVEEDMEGVIKDLHEMYEDWTFKDVANQAVLDGFIDSIDEIYES